VRPRLFFGSTTRNPRTSHSPPNERRVTAAPHASYSAAEEAQRKAGKSDWMDGAETPDPPGGRQQPAHAGDCRANWAVFRGRSRIRLSPERRCAGERRKEG